MAIDRQPVGHHPFPRLKGSRMSADVLVVGGDEIKFRIASPETSGALLVVEVRLAPGGGPPALHRHDAVEVLHVQRGQLALYVAEADGDVGRTVAGPGALIAIPSGREHTIRKPVRRGGGGDDDLRARW
jgi:quercetin dioxygenase-like cupin family protein